LSTAGEQVVKFWIGVTNNEWFNFLSTRSPDEVNFWQPGGTPFKALQPGEPFLFKLHSPLNYIVGGGFFVRHSILPISLVWNAFGEKNGAEDFESFRARIIRLRRQIKRDEIDPLIGCNILINPFFFQKDEWIPTPKDWSPNIVQGKTYDTNKSIGSALWADVQNRLKRIGKLVVTGADKVAEEVALYGAEYLTRARLGQGAFRVLVTDTYNRRCSITKERTLPVLDAAHIKPVAESGPHRIDNGILLRTDLHKLFDLGYMTITTDLHVEISRRIKEEFENGREYYALQGAQLHVPADPIYRPSREYIEWHNQVKYKT
jgi:putative restriction endonuclease